MILKLSWGNEDDDDDEDRSDDDTELTPAVELELELELELEFNVPFGLICELELEIIVILPWFTLVLDELVRVTPVEEVELDKVEVLDVNVWFPVDDDEDIVVWLETSVLEEKSPVLIEVSFSAGDEVDGNTSPEGEDSLVGFPV